MSSIDDEMRAQFDDLRAEDKSHAPEFSALLSGVAQHVNEPRRRTRAVWWFAAAASALVAATLVVQRVRQRDVILDSALAHTIPSSITSWTSPTGGLLRTSQQTTITSPSIRRSVLDGVVAPPGQLKSSKRGGL
jgi:hypothetical protein